MVNGCADAQVHVLCSTHVSIVLTATHTHIVVTNWGARDVWSSAPQLMSCN